MGKYFGTDGFRGEANVTLTADHAYKVGRFLGWYFNEKKKKDGDSSDVKIVIGKDTRLSSYMLEYALVGGLTASGARAYLLHVTTTPCVAYITRVDGFDCGIMISASHNPYYDNGIKLINSLGEKMQEDVTDRIESFLDGETGEIPFAVRESIGKSVDYVSGRNRYMGYLMSLAVHSFRGKRVGIDCANGSSWNMAKEIFEALGAEAFVINAEPDGMNINCESGSTDIAQLQYLVTEKKLDVGFAYDGDADRCICVDEKGNAVDGDAILYICAAYMKKRRELVSDTVVTTVMSNFGLYKAFDKLGINYAKTDVGDRYVYEYMMKNGCCLGGEQSGHIIFSKYASTGDGILTSLKIMEIIVAQDKSLSELASGFRAYPQELISIKVKDKNKVMTSSEVKNTIADVSEKLGSTGRVLVRQSGTEPVIRVMVEAADGEICRLLAESVVKAVKQADNGYL